MAIPEISLPGNGNKTPRPATSIGSLQRLYQAGNVLRSRPRAQSASDLLNRPAQAVEFSDDTLLGRNKTDHDDLAELIDFLRNQTPPSDNYMSIPDDGGERGRRWSVLKKLGRRAKSLPKTPPPIRLPDSAISGTTTGGHRHIAISIPLEASPFGTNPRSQYPIIENTIKPVTTNYAPTRAVVNDKGIVTVLRTVTEVRETPSTSPSAVSQDRSPLAAQYPVASPGGTVHAQASGNHTRVQNGGRAVDYFGVSPSVSPRPGVQQQRNVPRPEPIRNGNPSVRPQTLVHRSSYPIRGSSLTASRSAIPPTSIDGMMSQSINRDNNIPGSPGLSRSRSYNNHHHRPQQSTSGSTATSYNDSVMADSQKAETVKPMPVAVRSSEAQPISRRSSLHNPSKITVITESPFATAQPTGSTTPSIRSVQSRKEKVRDRKRRDMEALRNGSQKRGSIVEDGTTSPSKHDISTEESINYSSGSKNSKEQQATLCPVMVVSDVLPSPAPKAENFQPMTAPTTTTNKPTSKSKSIKKSALPAPVAYLNGSSNPTPPHSSNGSPKEDHTYMDRTSLSRRREWNANKEKERKSRETKAALRAKTRQLSQAREKTERYKGPTVEDEVLTRYEAYREYRIREMERRMRRLERNGDVWLRALVPVLDNLNKTIAHVHEDHPCRARGWVSDDEYTSRGRSMGYKGNAARGRRGKKQTKASERRFLNELARREDDLDSESSDDLSGLDTIEPLMRELQGRSRLSWETRRSVSEERRR